MRVPCLLLGLLCAAAGALFPGILDRKNFVLCALKSTEFCIAGEYEKVINVNIKDQIYSDPIKMCGISDLEPIKQNTKLYKISSLKHINGQFRIVYCKYIHSVSSDGATVPLRGEDSVRQKRQSPRVRYRGQTQSQYLALDQKDKEEGKAEAHAAPDSSRATVSGRSGMGQAQSQSSYDRSCEDNQPENLRGRNSIDYNPNNYYSSGSTTPEESSSDNMQRQTPRTGGRFPSSGGSALPIGSNTNLQTTSENKDPSYSGNRNIPTDSSSHTNSPTDTSSRAGIPAYNRDFQTPGGPSGPSGMRGPSDRRTGPGMTQFEGGPQHNPDGSGGYGQNNNQRPSPAGGNDNPKDIRMRPGDQIDYRGNPTDFSNSGQTGGPLKPSDKTFGGPTLDSRRPLIPDRSIGSSPYDSTNSGYVTPSSHVGSPQDMSYYGGPERDARVGGFIPGSRPVVPQGNIQYVRGAPGLTPGILHVDSDGNTYVCCVVNPTGTYATNLPGFAPTGSPRVQYTSQQHGPGSAEGQYPQNYPSLITTNQQGGYAPEYHGPDSYIPGSNVHRSNVPRIATPNKPGGTGIEGPMGADGTIQYKPKDLAQTHGTKSQYYPGQIQTGVETPDTRLPFVYSQGNLSYPPAGPYYSGNLPQLTPGTAPQFNLVGQQDPRGTVSGYGGQRPGSNGQDQYGPGSVSGLGSSLPSTYKTGQPRQHETGYQPYGQHPQGQYAQGQHPQGQLPIGQQPQGQYEQGQRPQGQLPQGQHPQGQYEQGQHPQGQYAQGKHPQGQYVQGQHPQGELPQGQHPQGQYAQGQQPQGHLPREQPPQGQYAQGQHPQVELPQGQYAQGQHPQGELPQGQHPQGQYAQGQQPQGHLPQGHLPQGHLPREQPPQGQHPQAELPQGQHPQGQYAQGQHPQGQQPQGQYAQGQHPQGQQEQGNSEFPKSTYGTEQHSPNQRGSQYPQNQYGTGLYSPDQQLISYPQSQNGLGQQPKEQYGNGQYHQSPYRPGQQHQEPYGTTQHQQGPYQPGQQPQEQYGSSPYPHGYYEPGKPTQGQFNPQQPPLNQYGPKNQVTVSPGQNIYRPEVGDGGLMPYAPSGRSTPGGHPIDNIEWQGENPYGAVGSRPVASTTSDRPGGQWQDRPGGGQWAGPRDQTESTGPRETKPNEQEGNTLDKGITGPGQYGQTTQNNSGRGPNNVHQYDPDSQNAGRINNVQSGQLVPEGIPQNVLDPNSIIDDDDSEAQATISQASNGTTALASSKGGNKKGRAQTQVQGSYTGGGSFSAQAQISDESKGAESQVNGGKQGASSSAQGKGRNNKSQAQVELGSETGSLQTQAQSEGVMHSSNSQVQGSVKGGMADAQARGPGSTSSQAQIGFTPYKEGDKTHEQLKAPFTGGGSASAQSSGRTGQSQSQLQGVFKYGIRYNGAAQSGSSLDKDAVFPNRLLFNKIDVFDKNNKNIDVDKLEDIDSTSEIPNNENDILPIENPETKNIDHPHSDHHYDESHSPVNNRRSFNYNHKNEYEYGTEKYEGSTDDYDVEAGYGAGADTEYPSYDEFNQDTTHQSLQSSRKKGLDIKQSNGGNTQHIVLGSLKNYDAEITQQNSEQRPDETRIYQPGERVPGTGGYTIPIGFTGSVKSVASKGKTYAIGTRDSPSQAQTVSLTPGTGLIKTKKINPKNLKSLDNFNKKKNEEDNKYVSVSKSVTGALDGNNKIKQQYSHTYYTKSSSCGYFTFTCTIVSGSNGRTKVCKPKIPTNPDGTPMNC